jgi:drug/metabolite transporter (DMT)-like permease
MKIQLKADLMLLMVAMFWGASTLLTKFSLGSIEGFNLIALRFIIAFGLASIVFWKKLRDTNYETIKYGAILAGILFIVNVLFTFGVRYTTVSNAGFLTCLASVFIPMILFIFKKEIPSKKVVLSITLAVIGIYLLTLNDKILFNLGDFLCILCSLAFAGHIIATGIFTRKVDPVTLGVIQLGFAAVYSSIFSIIFESPTLPSTAESWFTVLILSVFCTAVGFIVQTYAQKYTTSVHTGLIFSMEPLFAAFFAFAFAHELLLLRGYIGGIILVLSIINVEVDFKTIRKKPDKIRLL